VARLTAVNSRFAFTIAALGISLSACSMIGARPSASAGPTSSALPSPSQSATEQPTPSPLPSATPASTDQPSSGLEGRDFLSVLVTENGTSKALVSGTKIRLGFSNGMLSASAGSLRRR